MWRLRTMFKQTYNNVRTVNNVEINHDKKKSLWDHFLSWYGILGTTATIGFGVVAQYALHVQLGWWFFWM
jgi:hypothetical protein